MQEPRYKTLDKRLYLGSWLLILDSKKYINRQLSMKHEQKILVPGS